MNCTRSRRKQVNEKGNRNYECRFAVLSSYLYVICRFTMVCTKTRNLSGYIRTTSSLLCSHAGLRNIFLVYTNSTKFFMAQETLGYAVLCTDAYIVDVRVNNIERTSSCFDVALPCGNHLLQHDQPVLACRLQYENKQALADIPYGIYHIRAKVRALRISKTANVSHTFRSYHLFLPCYLQVLFWTTMHFPSWEI